SRWRPPRAEPLPSAPIEHVRASSRPGTEELMATMWRKAMLYLGLGPDDEYDDYDAVPDERPQPQREQAAPARQAPPRQAPPQAPVATRPRPAPPQQPSQTFSAPRPEPSEPPAVRTLPVPGDEAPKPRVRAVPRTPQRAPHVVEP